MNHHSSGDIGMGNGKNIHNDWREARRMRAFDMHRQGWKQVEIANALGVTEGAVSQWMRQARENGGRNGLAARLGAGRPCKVAREELAGKLPALLHKGANSFGFNGDQWTRARVVVVIEQTFGVRYSRQHVGVLLRAFNWSLQQPERRATQRDEAAIAEWRDTHWPALEKKRKRKDGRSAS